MPAKTEEEKLARVRLNFASCLRSDWILRLLEHYGGAGALLERGAGELASGAGVPLDTAERFVRETRSADPVRELEAARKAGVRVLTADEEDYPELLRRIPDPPLALYVKGRPPSGPPAAAIVGTRRPTAYGARSAARFAEGLARAGAAVVSGLARGVDTEAHKAALRAGGRTWAVMGTGLGTCYPPENAKLADRIAASGGALVSEFPMGTQGLPAHFPRRNRVISGLSHAVLVVEGDFKSGALITARAALEQGREVLALPGPVDSAMSRGPNMLIKNGAALAEGPVDVIAAMPPEALFGLDTAGLARGAQEKPAAPPKGLSPDAAAACRAIRGADGGLGVDGLAERLGWQVQRIAAALFELEAAALITPSADKYVPK